MNNKDKMVFIFAENHNAARNIATNHCLNRWRYVQRPSDYQGYGDCCYIMDYISDWPIIHMNEFLYYAESHNITEWHPQEKEPEFQVGDWVIGTRPDLTIYKKAYQVTSVIAETVTLRGCKCNYTFEYIRHATQEEILEVQDKMSFKGVRDFIKEQGLDQLCSHTDLRNDLQQAEQRILDYCLQDVKNTRKETFKGVRGRIPTKEEYLELKNNPTIIIDDPQNQTEDNVLKETTMFYSYVAARQIKVQKETEEGSKYWKTETSVLTLEPKVITAESQQDAEIIAALELSKSYPEIDRDELKVSVVPFG